MTPDGEASMPCLLGYGVLKPAIGLGGFESYFHTKFFLDKVFKRDEKLEEYQNDHSLILQQG
jgi:hypothetical protein